MWVVARALTCYNLVMRIITVIFFLLAIPAFAAEDSSILNPSGLPIPRYVSLKSDEVNVRVGPGKRYPIRYVYRREHLPVQIVAEFAHWRKIIDYEGTSGWVHKGMVDGKRRALIMSTSQTIYAKPSDDAQPVMRAGKLVIGDLTECTPDWCELVIEGRKGWIRKADIWGITREEVVEK